MELETFKHIMFDDDGEWFTEAELHEMIDEELKKDPDIMDTNLIGLCLDALDGKFDPPSDETDKPNN